MERHAIVMKMKPNMQEEYKKGMMICGLICLSS